jgi:hypothetical protein
MKYTNILFFSLLFLACQTELDKKVEASLANINISFINTLEDYPIQIFTEDKNGNEKHIKTVPANTTFQYSNAQPQQLFYFKPKGNSHYEILPYSADSLKNQSHELRLAQKRYGESKNTYKRITNATANRYSFDIVKLDPFNIDADEAHGGGRKRLIFEELSDFDRDWYPFDGDFAVKNQFKVQFINEGKSIERTELFRSMSSFQKEFTTSIKASAKSKAVAATGSASWSKLTKNSQDTESLFSWFRKEDKKYFIQLQPSQVQLDKGFKAAIAQLPVPNQLPNTIKEAVVKQEFDHYYQFVKDWGTHYPKKVTYGGIIQGSQNSNRSQISELVEKGFNVKAGLAAPVKGVKVGAGGGFNKEERAELEQITQNSHKEYVYKGGEGYFELWAVGDEVQPIYIDLENLSDLIIQDYLPEGQQLIAKRRMLQLAIDYYLQEFPLPNPEENNIIAYELICTGITFPSCSDADKPYHTLDRVKISMWPGLKKKMLKKGTRYVLNEDGVVWEFKKNKESVSIPEASRKKRKETKSLSKWTENLQKPKMIFMMNPKKISKTERDQVKLRFWAHFEEDDGWDKKDEITKGGTYEGIQLKNVKKDFKHYTLEINEEGKTAKKSKLNAKVFFKIRKIDLFE